MIYTTPATQADEDEILADLIYRAKCSAWARHQLEQYLELRYMPSYTPAGRPANIAEATAMLMAALKQGIDGLVALDQYDGLDE